MTVDPKTTLGVLEWIVRRWLDVEALWMNVRISQPRTRDKVQFGWVKIEGTYRADLRKDLVLFHRTGNVYFRSNHPFSAKLRDFGTAKFTSETIKAASIRSSSLSYRQIFDLCANITARFTVKLSIGSESDWTLFRQA